MEDTKQDLRKIDGLYVGDHLNQKPTSIAGQEIVINNFACPICEEQINFENIAVLSACSHVICRTCCIQYIRSELRNLKQPVCPLGCGKRISQTASILKSLNENEKQKFNKAILHRVVQESGLKICPNNQCAGGVIVQAINSSLPIMQCIQCQTKYCQYCFEKQHTGKCDNKTILNLLQNLNYSQCQKCGMLVQRIEGCDKMVCRCGYRFCYLCEQYWESHFHRCPKSKNNKRKQKIMKLKQQNKIDTESHINQTIQANNMMTQVTHMNRNANNSKHANQNNKGNNNYFGHVQSPSLFFTQMIREFSAFLLSYMDRNICYYTIMVMFFLIAYVPCITLYCVFIVFYFLIIWIIFFPFCYALVMIKNKFAKFCSFNPIFASFFMVLFATTTLCFLWIFSIAKLLTSYAVRYDMTQLLQLKETHIMNRFKISCRNNFENYQQFCYYQNHIICKCRYFEECDVCGSVPAVPKTQPRCSFQQQSRSLCCLVDFDQIWQC